MRRHSEDLLEVLRGSFSTRLVLDASYGAERTAKDLPGKDWQFTFDSEASIKAYGDVDVVYTPEAAESLTPTEFTHALAPFGQEVNALLEVSAGDFRETVQLGHFRITGVPSASDEFMDFQGRVVPTGSRVSLSLQDRLIAVERAGFRSEQSPPSLASCWAEIQRLTGMQVLRSVPDKPIPASTVYLAEQGGRLKAVQALADVLGGVAYVTPDGAVSVIPDEVGPVVAELVLGDEGTILEVGHSMASEGVYNEVVGNFEDYDRNPIFAVANITEGPLAITGPFGRYTRYYSSPFVKTQHGAESAVQAILSQSVGARTYRVPVTCVINPLIEMGDTVSVQRPDGTLLIGRVVSVVLSAGRYMDLVLDVVRKDKWAKPIVPPWVVHPTSGYGITPFDSGLYGDQEPLLGIYGSVAFGLGGYGAAL